METSFSSGEITTSSSNEDLIKFEKIVNQLESKVKLVKKDNFRKLDNNQLWETIVCQICVMGSSRNWEKLKKSDKYKEFAEKIKLTTIAKQNDKNYLQGIFKEYKPTRFPKKSAEKLNKILDNKGIVNNFKVVILDGLDSSMDYNEIRNSLMERNPFFKMKSASDFMIELGLSDDVIAIDTRIIGILRKHFSYNLDLGKVQSNKQIYLSLEETLRSMCKKMKIQLGLLDRMLYKYANMDVISFLLTAQR